MIKFETLLGIQELSEQLGMNKFSIYKKIQKNQFPKGVKIHGRRMWKPEQIKEYYQQMGITIEFTHTP